MEPYTVTINDPTHDSDEGFDRGSGSSTPSNHTQGIQDEFESSREDIISVKSLSKIFSSSSDVERHHDIMVPSSHSMPSLPSFAVTSPLNNRGGGQFADIFSSSTVERQYHDILSCSMSSLPSFAVTLPNNSRGGQSRMAKMERPYNYVTSNNSHDTDKGFDRGTRTCSSNQGRIQNEYVPSQENNVSNIFSSSTALDEMHLLSSPSHSVSSLPTSSPVTSNKGGVGKLRRSRSLVSNSWNVRFHELIQFRETNDHCFVPRIYHENPRLSQWVQKQRHQRKRKDQGLHSTLNDERQELLTIAGFCWDSQQALWKERFRSLEIFQCIHGHCIVPSNHPDLTLFNWARYQRKQFKLYQAGSESSMDEERVLHLVSIGFE